MPPGRQKLNAPQQVGGLHSGPTPKPETPSLVPFMPQMSRDWPLCARPGQSGQQGRQGLWGRRWGAGEFRGQAPRRGHGCREGENQGCPDLGAGTAGEEGVQCKGLVCAGLHLQAPGGPSGAGL